MARAFIIRPFKKKKDSSGKEIDFESIHQTLIKPALEATKLYGGTTGDIIEPGNIREDLFKLILEADLVLCDITVDNANVFYELGIRHALRKKRTILIKGIPTSDPTPPFDILTDRFLEYEIDNPAAARDKLIDIINASLKSECDTDSPIFMMVPCLSEADPSAMCVVPMGFREKVKRAQATKSKSRLRLLGDEVLKQRFLWGGLKLVATAQWDVKDYEGARYSWEVIRESYPNDIIANLALANIYQRLYLETKVYDQIVCSDQAIDRVLDCSSTNRKQRAEALALQGRNQKTHWRLKFSHLATYEERREKAMNYTLVRSYNAYYEAFFEDLNHFYPGLNALQMGTILTDLVGENEWNDAFGAADQENSCRKKINEQIISLHSLVPASVMADLGRRDKTDPDRLWAKVSKADILFLTNNSAKSIIAAYLDAIPDDKPFVWDAARTQLELFSELGVQAELAQNVIAEVNSSFN